MPLRKPIAVTLVLPQGLPARHVGIARRDDEDAEWDWNDARYDSVARTFTTTTSRLGQFALVRDEAPPEVSPPAAPTKVPGGPYPTWALTARAKDAMSGVAGDASGLKSTAAACPPSGTPRNTCCAGARARRPRRVRIATDSPSWITRATARFARGRL
jgi:hypothetical protein